MVKSSSLVPESDPTLLFANAGMNQFKDAFLGKEKRAYVRAASSQKCVRAGGKHNDLENVGVTARHHTFFEMLGNFSFGDYFKKEAIAFAWELLTKDFGLPEDRLQVTIFKGEGSGAPRRRSPRLLAGSRARRTASSSSGRRTTSGPWATPVPAAPAPRSTTSRATPSPARRRRRAGSAWASSASATAGSRSGTWSSCSTTGTAQGTLNPLPAPCVDTGMGLERIAAVVQGKLSNYDTDLFQPLIAAVGRRTSRTYGQDAADDVSLRVVADHLRAMTFLIADGVLPGNEGRGYVLRKIMRRAMRHVKKLGVEEPCLFELVRAVVDRMAGAYPELLEPRGIGGQGGAGRGAALRDHPEAGHRRLRPDRRQAPRGRRRWAEPRPSSSTTPTASRWTSPRSWPRSAASPSTWPASRGSSPPNRSGPAPRASWERSRATRST